LANDDYNVCVSYIFSLSPYFYNINPIRVLKYNLIKLNRKINRKMDKNFDELLMNFDEFF
jgi:L-arabinose isomerase